MVGILKIHLGFFLNFNPFESKDDFYSYSSTSFSFLGFFKFFLLVLPGFPPWRDELGAKSMLFSEKVLTRNEAALTIFLPTLKIGCVNNK